MKKFLLSVVAMLSFACMPLPMLAQSYNFDKVDWRKMVDVFYEALKRGDKYPDDTEIQALGISKADLAFIRSHVKRRPTIGDDRRLLPETYESRKLWMNTPMGSGAGASAGYRARYSIAMSSHYGTMCHFGVHGTMASARHRDHGSMLLTRMVLT